MLCGVSLLPPYLYSGWRKLLSLRFLCLISSGIVTGGADSRFYTSAWPADEPGCDDGARAKLISSSCGHFVAVFQVAENFNQVSGDGSCLHVHPFRAPIADLNHERPLQVVPYSSGWNEQGGIGTAHGPRDLAETARSKLRRRIPDIQFHGHRTSFDIHGV